MAETILDVRSLLGPQDQAAEEDTSMAPVFEIDLGNLLVFDFQDQPKGRLFFFPADNNKVTSMLKSKLKNVCKLSSTMCSTCPLPKAMWVRLLNCRYRLPLFQEKSPFPNPNLPPNGKSLPRRRAFKNRRRGVDW